MHNRFWKKQNKCNLNVKNLSEIKDKMPSETLSQCSELRLQVLFSVISSKSTLRISHSEDNLFLFLNIETNSKQTKQNKKNVKTDMLANCYLRYNAGWKCEPLIVWQSITINNLHQAFPAIAYCTCTRVGRILHHSFL